MLQMFNTLTRQKEVFQPIHANKINLYACGVTVYDYCHLGHARTYTSLDVIIRYLRFSGYEVCYVRNITDIDDKIIKRANENQEDFTQITQRFIQAMHEDFMALGLTVPDHEPRATNYILQMNALIEKIITNKHAYVASNGDVYFDVRSFKQYGCLSHHNIEQLESGARVEVAEVKRDPLDFVLWKLAKPGEPSWDSPWGKGRPGWHIECSAMAMDLLGEDFDLHAGGRDLIFPHHENEIAQSQAASHKAFAKTWLHTGFLQTEKEKMSKSLGNFVTIRDVLKQHSPEVIRYFLISNHYRSPLLYTEEALHQAKQSLARFYTALRFYPETERVQQTTFEAQFVAAMDDDFNTPVALSVLFELAHEIQRLKEKDNLAAASHAALLKYLGGVLGILQNDPEYFFQSGSAISAEKIASYIADRNEARRQKNWAEADRIRKELADSGVTIEDSASGTTWKFSK
ncbi:MAG: cysteine--tRNA ligase [Gammaproteobacteria bacterium]|nr:cysteine--tRNA ligase [Gammaproteobacteria bacterium]